MDEARILVVDDIEENIELIKAFLEQEGYDIITADNGRDALEIIKKRNIDLVLLDVIMPGCDGFEICKKIKFDLKMEDLPVVMVTALNAREDRLKGLDVGADDFISKPIDWAELIGRVRSLLRLRNAYVTLHQQIEKMNYQLDLARTVQRGLMKIEMPEGLKGEVYYGPTDEIGGDIVEVVPLAGKKYGVFLADTSGHGVPAALIMVMVKQIFNNIINNKQFNDPDEVISELNTQFIEQLAENTNDVYVTALYTIIDYNTKEIRWSNAGHTFPILIDKEGDWRELKDSGFPLGIMKETCYNLNTIDISENSRLFVYTDGLADLMNKGEYIFDSRTINNIIGDLLEIEENGKTSFFGKIVERGMEQETDDDICYTLIEL